MSKKRIHFATGGWVNTQSSGDMLFSGETVLTKEMQEALAAVIKPAAVPHVLTAKEHTMQFTIRKEQRRVLYGFERKTRLQLVMCKYTRSQTSHRYNALRRGYFVMQDCSEQSGERYNIYYDDETERSAQFEANCIKDGFTFKRYE